VYHADNADGSGDGDGMDALGSVRRRVNKRCLDGGHVADSHHAQLRGLANAFEPSGVAPERYSCAGVNSCDGLRYLAFSPGRKDAG
jgi:hypothetical protein